MRLPTNPRVGHTLAAIALSGMLVGCGQAPRTDSPSGPASRAPASAPRASAAPAATGTPSATLLPGGLAARPGLPLIDGEAAGCVPGCEEYGTVQGGRLPTGRYQTQWFFDGFMTVESDGSWPISEDSTAELSLVIRDNYLIHFGLDPQLVLHGVIDTKVKRTAKAYAEWLRAHPDLVVSSPVAATMGSIPALSVDVKLGPKAGQDEADCGSDPADCRRPATWSPPPDVVEEVAGTPEAIVEWLTTNPDFTVIEQPKPMTISQPRRARWAGHLIHWKSDSIPIKLP